MLKKNVVLSVLFLGVVLAAGCASIIKGSKTTMTYNSNPVGAEVYVNGNYLGKTPFQMQMKTNQSYTFEFRKEGHVSQTYVVNHYVGAGWVILDVLLGLLPVIVDAATGDWNYLDQTNLNASLQAK